MFILLTISAGKYVNPIWQLGKGSALLDWVIILPFFASSIIILFAEIKKFSFIEKNVDDEIIEKKYSLALKRSLVWVCGGFCYIIIFLGLYMLKLTTS